jgi:hypothetical protein
MSKSEKRREPIPAGGPWTREERQRARAQRKAEQGFQPGDEIVVSLPDPDRPGHTRRFRAKIIERLGKRSASERGKRSLSARRTKSTKVECVDGPRGCEGPVEFRVAPDRDDLKTFAVSKVTFPRCKTHWEQRLDEARKGRPVKRVETPKAKVETSKVTKPEKPTKRKRDALDYRLPGSFEGGKRR